MTRLPTYTRNQSFFSDHSRLYGARSSTSDGHQTAHQQEYLDVAGAFVTYVLSGLLPELLLLCLPIGVVLVLPNRCGSRCSACCSCCCCCCGCCGEDSEADDEEEVSDDEEEDEGSENRRVERRRGADYRNGRQTSAALLRQRGSRRSIKSRQAGVDPLCPTGQRD